MGVFRPLRLVPAALCAAFLVVDAARGDDFLGNVLEAFGFDVPEPEPAPAIVIDAAPAFGGDEAPFVAQVKTLLGTELHFVRKVCAPDDAQMDEIRKAGLAEVEAIAKRVAAMQARNQHDGWPDARGQLTRALLNSVTVVMPVDAAERYAAELEARKEARKEAAAEMMTTLVDRKLSLTPKQYDEVTAAARGRWKEEWARDFQIYLYEEYAPTPDGQAVQAALTERQRKLWGGANRYGRIFFGWEHELGLDWGGQVELGRDLLVEKSAPEKPEEGPPEVEARTRDAATSEEESSEEESSEEATQTGEAMP